MIPDDRFEKKKVGLGGIIYTTAAALHFVFATIIGSLGIVSSYYNCKQSDKSFQFNVNRQVHPAVGTK